MQLSSQARKAVAAGLAASTLLWSAMIAAPQFASAAVHSEGCLVLSGGVVWLITGGTRRGFTSAEVFMSGGYNFSQVVSATAEDAALPVGPIMTYADGTLVKGPNDPLVYLVAGGQKRPFVSGSVFLGLGYSFANIQQAPVNTFQDLPTGSNLDSTTIAHPAGTRVISGGAVWLMTGSGRMGYPSGAVFTSYGIGFNKVVAANSYDLALPDQGAVSARAVCTGGDTTPPVSGSISAMLASDNPASSTLVAGQALADLAHFSFSGSGAINSLVFERIGVSANSTLSNVYLFSGTTRLTDSGSVSADNKVTFAGLNINVPVTVAVKSDIAGSTSGQTVGVRLVSTNGSATSVSGNIHTIASASLATVAISSSTGSGNTDPGTDINVWTNTFTVGTRDVVLNRLALRQIGSIQSADIRNFRLMVDGTQVASAASLDSNGYVVFTPNTTLKSGTRTMKVNADVIGGSGRTVSMSLRSTSDLSVTDSSYNVGVLATGTFPSTVSAFTVNAGTLTVAKATDSPSANVVAGASDISVGKWTFTAFGEPVKVETLTVGVDTDDTDSTVTFRNVRVLVNGSQVGSTTDVAAVDAAATGQSFTTNFYVYPGTPVTVEVRSDMYDSEGTDEIGAGTLTTPKFYLVAGSSNGIPQTSLTPINVPTSSVGANQLTIATGSISLAKTLTYPNQTIVAPQTAYKLASYTLSGNASEAVNVNTFTLSLAVADTDTTGNLTVAGDITNVYLVYGSTTSSIKSTVATSGNTWSPTLTVPVNGNVTVDVYGTLSSDFTATDTATASLLVSGTTASSGQAVSTNSGSVLAGQTITIGTGTITATKDASSASAQLVDDSGTVSTAAFNFAAVTDSYTITDVTLRVATCTAVSNIALKDGSTVLANKPCSAPATDITFSGLNVPVAANQTKVLTVELTMNTIGVGAGSTDSDLTTTLTAFTARNSNGTSAAGSETNPAGNALYAYKSVPLVSQVALPNSDLSASTMTIAKFTVSSNGTGTVVWKQIMLKLTKTATPVIAAPTLWNADTGEQITAAVVYQNGTAGVATTCSSDNTACEALITVGTNADDDTAEVISGARTYEVRAAITGAIASTDSVSVTLQRNTVTHAASAAEQTNDNSLAAANVSFVWSDASGSGVLADTGNATWQKDYLVKNLPLTWALN